MELKRLKLSNLWLITWEVQLYGHIIYQPFFCHTCKTKCILFSKCSSESGMRRGNEHTNKHELTAMAMPRFTPSCKMAP